jgi:tetratricopeptide (TPR) repeat protein
MATKQLAKFKAKKARAAPAGAEMKPAKPPPQAETANHGRAAYSVARPLFERALAISEKSYGPDHPEVAMGLNNLANLLRDTNRLSEAEPLYRRALAIDEKSYGANHPNVARDH